MPWIAGVASAVGGAVAANQGRQQSKAAIAAQQRLASQLMTTPEWVKKSKANIFGVLDPQVQAYLRGEKPQVISPDMQSAWWKAAYDDMRQPFEQQQRATEQSLTNRGLDYGNVLSTAQGANAERFNRTVQSTRADIAQKAALANYAADQDLQNRIMQLFGMGMNRQAAREAMAAQIGSGANAASAANSQQYAGALGQGFGSIMGSIPWGSFGGGGGEAGATGNPSGPWYYEDPTTGYFSGGAGGGIFGYR